MTATRSLKLLWTPWSLAITVVVLIAVGILCYVSWRRRGSRRVDGFLELLRWGLVALGALLLNQPEFTEEFRPDTKPTVAVLCDVSPSMETRDVVRKVSGKDGTAVSRNAASQRLRESATWAALSEELNVEVRTFGNDEERSNLFASITEAVNQSERLLGVVLASDGEWNEGGPPVTAATRMRVRGIPLLSLIHI